MAQDPISSSSNGAAASHPPAGAYYSHTPQDARLIALMIASMGIKDMEPGVEMMLLEWANRYIHTILSDSQSYAAHASSSSSSNPQISLPDLYLAIQSNLSHSHIQQPSKPALLSLASTLNATPLPPISDRYGLRLPPKEHCLTNVNFTIVPDELDDDDDEEDEGDEGDDNDGIDSRPVVGEQDANSPAPAAATAAASTADVSMEESSAGDAARGVKRSLDEDDDYD